MNGRIVWRVMWKEYRALRGLWIAVAVASWMAQVVAILFDRQFSLVEIAYGAALITPVFYVFGVAAAMFAGEREDGTDRLLRALPVPTWPLATGKVLFVAVSTLAIIPAAGLLAVGELWWPSPGRVDPRGAGGLEFIWGPAIVEGAVWGLFFSLLCRGVMQAATLAALAAAATVTIALHLTNNTAISQVDPMQYAQSLWLRLAIVGVVVLVDWMLARDWLTDRSAAGRDAGAAPASALGALATRFTAWLARVRRWQVRLTWLQFRQSAQAMALVAVAPIALSAVTPELADRVQLPQPAADGIWHVDLRWEATLMVLAALIGTQVFAGDKQRKGYRCLAEQGSSAGAVWFNRQAVGLAWLVGAVALWHVAWWLRFGWGDRERPLAYFDAFIDGSYESGWNPSDFMTWREVAAVGIVYAAGQVGSLLLTGGIVSTLVGLVLAAAAYGWSALMIYLLLPAGFTVWPLALGLLAATAVFARGWLIDRRGLTTWLLTAAAFGVFAGVALAAIPGLRLQGLSDQPVAFDVDEFRATLGAEAQQTADLYRRAVDTLRTYDEIEDELAPPDATTGEREPREEVNRRRARGEFTELDRGWLAANQPSIELVLQANARPTCAFTREVRGVGGRSLGSLFELMLLRGQAAANLEAELAAYGDLLRFIEHLRPSFDSFMGAVVDERRVLNNLLRWSVKPGQTADRLRQARRALEAHAARTPGPDQAIKLKYLETLRTLEAGDQQYRFPLDYYLARLPWERTRAHWMLNAWANHNLSIVDGSMQQVGERVMDFRRGVYRDHQEELQASATPALRASIADAWGLGYFLADYATHRRARMNATILLLELAATRLEKGKLPQSLNELVTDEFVELPGDPFTGGSFEYFPQGFPVEVEGQVEIGKGFAEALEVGPAALWSPGGTVTRTYSEHEGKLVKQFTVYRGNYARTLDTDLGGWQAGLVFPVPQPSPATPTPAP